MSTPDLTPAQQCVLRFLNVLFVAQTSNAIYAVLLMHGHRCVFEDVMDPLEMKGCVNRVQGHGNYYITPAGQHAAAASEGKP